MTLEIKMFILYSIDEDLDEADSKSDCIPLIKGKYILTVN